MVTHDSDQNSGEMLKGQQVCAGNSFRKWNSSSLGHEDIGCNFKKR